MASNIYFQNSIADQNLLNEINREVIQQAGIDVMYLPRTLVKEDLVMNEDVLSKFSNAYQVTAFIKSSIKITNCFRQLHNIIHSRNTVIYYMYKHKPTILKYESHKLR